jgi:hypothetical protein
MPRNAPSIPIEMVVGPDRSLDARDDVQLSQYIAHVKIHGPYRDAKLRSDLFVTQPLCNKDENLFFAGRQALQDSSDVGKPPFGTRSLVSRPQNPSLACQADGSHDPFWRLILEQVSNRAGRNHLCQVSIIVISGERNHPDGPSLSLNAGGDGPAVQIRELAVQNQDIGGARFHETQSLKPTVSFAHNFDIGLSI